MAKVTSKEIVKKSFIIISGLAFFWFSASSVIEMITKPATPSVNQSQGEDSSAEALLKKEVKGYELVLEKEPDNRFALEKLVEIQLQLRNLQAALPLTEKLVKLDPQNTRYQQVLKIIKQGLAQEKSQTQPPINSPNNNEENKEK
ncbi:FOG: TPR repeat [Geminocystis sp. NIES-3708]|uniref:tetratricopeptide repeat protein n=1 Tax=Geminocystis sp. NIES-3708 TaxID=1615909 RepID=UPI0005FC4A33|nr:tetratricopeptide repeat protein [Geminocystis sp. NIES-3708]BAQ60606.1 FOG: TPR repeat [Geminocystis sp. NIES-3708]